MTDAPVISCKNVWKVFGADPKKYLAQLPESHSFDDIRADGYIAGVKDVSIDVARGEMLVIMGLSGSGKSTLVRCFSRLHDITGGVIEVEGQDIMKLSEKELIDLRRNKMGMVFQSFGLLPHRTVLENVAFPLEMRGQDKHERRKRALEVVKLVGLEGREEYFPRELSGGQQQRVGIARSLAIEPDIWFLDEPFSALDPLIRREMQDEFLRLQGLLGKTIVFITHKILIARGWFRRAHWRKPMPWATVNRSMQPRLSRILRNCWCRTRAPLSPSSATAWPLAAFAVRTGWISCWRPPDGRYRTER